ncbi:hypothetical protein HK104_008194 [Borealophlyctis nickersoniae]|nr:hypothetical protein HK104_008194 [Borealophlyctis nickersoniae]
MPEFVKRGWPVLQVEGMGGGFTREAFDLVTTMAVQHGVAEAVNVLAGMYKQRYDRLRAIYAGICYEERKRIDEEAAETGVEPVYPWGSDEPKPFGSFDDKEGYNEQYPSDKLILRCLKKIPAESDESAADRFLGAAVQGTRLSPVRHL